MGGEYIGGYDEIDSLHKNSKLHELLTKYGIEHDDNGIKILKRGNFNPKEEKPSNFSKFLKGMLWKFKWLILRRVFVCTTIGAAGFYFLGPWGLLCIIPAFFIDKFI